MKKFILDLRKRPQHVRVQILYVSTLTAAAILFLLWVYSLGVNISDSKLRGDLKKDLEPFNLLKEGIADSTKQLSWPLSSTNEQQQ